jgi:NTE family protein
VLLEMAIRQGQLNPLGLNPMRRVLDDLLDPSVFGAEGAPMLVVSTTRVRTGQPRLFRDAEITTQVLLASSCLPQLFPAIDIEGEPYWDGGYASNPPVRALIVSGAPADLVVIRTMPVERPDLPTSAGGLLERTNELAFGAALRHELGSLAFAQRLLADLPERAPGALGRLRAARLHMIGAEKAFRALKDGSHLDLTATFLKEMRNLGHAAADEWIAENLGSVGVRSTLDLSPFADTLIETRPNAGV